jgi:hypothetical protein
LISDLESLDQKPAAIEAVWDGDTVHDWMVAILAIFRDSSGTLKERHVATVTSGSSNGPMEQYAAKIGAQIATHFDIPFFFASPSAPDLDAPRWKP